VQVVYPFTDPTRDDRPESGLIALGGALYVVSSEGGANNTVAVFKITP